MGRLDMPKIHFTGNNEGPSKDLNCWKPFTFARLTPPLPALSEQEMHLAQSQACPPAGCLGRFL